MKTSIIFSFLLLCSIASLGQDSLRYFYNEGVAGYNANDLHAYQSAFQSANQIRPYHPTIVYHLARAHALLSDHSKAFDVAKIMALMNGNLNALSDSSFIEFNKTSFGSQLSSLVEKVNAPIQNSSTFMSLETKSFHPEAITYGEQNFYLGGVHDREILIITEEGESRSLLNYKSNSDLFAVMGLAYDEKEKIIWACSAALPEMTAYAEELEGKSSVFAIDLKGNVVKSETISGNHLFGDLVVGKNGTVFISDGVDNSIYTISLNSDLEKKLDLADKTYNLQGLALDNDESHLYLTDYILGLFYVDLETGTLKSIPLVGDLVSKGLDGICFYKNSVIAIQNGTTPDRVWRFYLNEEGDEVIKREIIDQALEEFNEPTQGVIREGKIYYLANSPWSFYEDGKFLVEKVPETIILQADLN